MDTDNHWDNFDELDPRLQRRAVGIGLFIVAILIGSFVLMINAAKLWNTLVITESWLLLYQTAIGGIFGGSARSLFMLISEIGIHSDKPKASAAAYLSRWFLYLVKPILGGASGVLFYLAVSFGFVGPLTGGNVTFTILPVFFVSSVGGIFFEEVWSVLNGLLSPITSKDKSETKN